MDLFDTNTTFERQLFAKAARNRIPLYGVLELLPLCNLNCDMCYVHLSKQEMQSQGRLRSLDEWISLAKQMKDAGTLFLLLTGGEPLLFPQFKELYCALKDMGMILTLNTNGTLINEEWAEFFAKNKPRRINITLYGSKNETYENLCHMKDGFDKTIRGIELLKKYNEEEFHIRHALTVEGVMIYFAEQMGYNEDFWGLVGLLHDVDFEKYPDEHCKKAPELLKEINASDEMVHAICSHGYGSCSDIKPEHAMEKVLYAVDELTGLIWAAAKMRPSKSTKDMEVSSLKKKFKDKKFAAGCSRDVISKGAEVLEMSLEELFEKTILAMRSCEDIVEEELKEVCK